MKRGFGTVYKRGSIWWVKWYVDGLACYESSKSTVKQNAVDLLKTKLNQNVTTTTRQVRVDELLDDLCDYYKIHNPKSYEDFCLPCVKALRDFFTGHKASKIGTNAINDYKKHRKDAGKANGTVNRELALLRRAYHLAFEATPRKVAEVPKFKLFPEAPPRKGFLEPEQFEKFLVHVPEKYKGLVTLAYCTGARKSELLNLKKSQVDLEARHIVLYNGETKNNEGRHLPIFQRMLPVVEHHLRQYPSSPWLFSEPDGTRIPDIVGSWETICRKAGMPKLLFHDFRRSAVRNMVRSGTSEHTAMKISGHRSAGVFRRYNIISERDIDQAGERLEQFFTGRTLDGDKNGDKIQAAGSQIVQTMDMMSIMGITPPDGEEGKVLSSSRNTNETEGDFQK